MLQDARSFQPLLRCLLRLFSVVSFGAGRVRQSQLPSFFDCFQDHSVPPHFPCGVVGHHQIGCRVSPDTLRSVHRTSRHSFGSALATTATDDS
ncbi:hypothetical protein J3A83DRAFT_416251 [Scleroderma citrinum]